MIGYSVKARGIAKDLFGSEEEYVIPIYDLTSENDLWSGFEKIMGRENSIRRILEDRMPEYIGRAKELGSILDRFG